MNCNQKTIASKVHSKYSVGKRLNLIREDGVVFMDAVSGTFNLPLGYNHAKIVKAVSKQLHRCAHMKKNGGQVFYALTIQLSRSIIFFNKE